ncbi:hypothetical protein SBOR_1229 [Sclerotinia borealis F-4128]|uniref:Uncharacterized protein n=1 Tax=Sclerotinia borealis (strain F-4128) TaxID=1432307 RepID=W9CR82_SCLBF|nr:hypothetical protein SBOR_1229 [Sclerotinia borealis F-4128]
MEFGKSAATEAPTFTFNLDPNPSKTKKGGTPFQPCPRTDCVEYRTKHYRLVWQLKEARQTLETREGVLRTRIAQTESYDQRLQAAQKDITAYDEIVEKLEASYIAEKLKNGNYADLEVKHLELKAKMADKAREDELLILDLRQQIAKLKYDNDNNEDYIKTAEANIKDRESHVDALHSRIKAQEEEIRTLKTDKINFGNEAHRLTRENTKVQEESNRVRNEFSRLEKEIKKLQEEHAVERQNFHDRIVLEQTKLEDFRNDANEVRKHANEMEVLLKQKDVETKDLLKQLDVVAVELKNKGGVATEDQQKALAYYIMMARSLVTQVGKLQQTHRPTFLAYPEAYWARNAAGKKLEGDAENDEEEEEEEGIPQPEEEVGSSSTSSSSEYESPQDEQEEEKEEGSPDLQLIHRARRRGHGAGAGIIKYINRIVHVPGQDIVHTVPGPPVEVPVPGPIQYINREVSVPGPVVYVDVPGEEVPGPIRYTPFRVFAHNPITCWLMVEFNFLVLFSHWVRHLLAYLSWLPVAVYFGYDWTPPTPDYAATFSSDSDADEAGAPPDGGRLHRPGSTLFSALFRTRPGRMPSTWNTFWGLAFHAFVYLTIWLSFSVWKERALWFAENDATRRWLHQVLAQRASNGFLGMNQILPQTINRQLDILKFDLLQLAGIPVTYQFPG